MEEKINIDTVGNTSGDVYALNKLIQNMIVTIRKQQTCYNQVYEKALQHKADNTTCHLQNCGLIFTVPPSVYDWSTLEQKIKNLQPKIRQAKEERDQRQIANDIAIENIKSEIDYLRQEINSIQKNLSIKPMHSTPGKRRLHDIPEVQNQSLPF
ncbi:hypothetical protein TVAG_184820 [Trichomonas vaginalis G3]|uniref:Uncharacterized protein n=1 Tax=Trichomonas vaginalis (strain ATCC PRA-98 / G3) TaxID=412133 RepID=A2D8C7_TRIV3|nr:hypothetical protein TVAGG3_0393940 [Trichomonas vaginalis G3]EAY23176.1 hypothetical protein TVAG_184820 [Trichomonas vaginalis G3]KAI5534191.1 hypothetical protein TVAGG3_0393940 [Trichomonas vaginalis G3]|eukprot:XP_001584162.1 hypothetical protein [Trichomonas vaginalis G3]